MKKLWIPLWFLAAVVLAQLPQHSQINADFTKGRQQFDINLKKNSTIQIPFSFFNGTNTWTATGWTGVLQWAESASSTNLGTASQCLTGTISGSTCTFTPLTNTFTSTFEKWYCRVMLTSNQYSVPDLDGWITVEN